MKSSLETKLSQLSKRHAEVAASLSDPAIISDQNKFRDLSKEFSQLEPVVECFVAFQKAHTTITDNETMLAEETDTELKQMAEEEIATAKQQMQELEEQLQVLLLPKDPDDERNIYLEIRAGTGGDEAAIFAGDLFRMYSRFAEQRGWQVEMVSGNQGEHGGFKEVIAKVMGTDVYATLKFESGAHRVQRVPETESQGRVHTSACTVAILPEADEIGDVEISPDEIRVDTFRSSGAGGQHVNTTDSAIRITHIPTGIVVECQDERSQHKNRAKAMSLLQTRIMAAEKAKQQQQQADARRNLVGSGDRSERIRTYNFPQGRVTDHRINLTLYKLNEVMEGQLDQVVEPLAREHQADQLSQLNDAD